jgi:hypothetical protein
MLSIIWFGHRSRFGNIAGINRNFRATSYSGAMAVTKTCVSHRLEHLPVQNLVSNCQHILCSMIAIGISVALATCL